MLELLALLYGEADVIRFPVITRGTTMRLLAGDQLHVVLYLPES